MLFRRLLERQARASYIIAAEGYAVSFVAHAIIVGATLYAARGVAHREIAESFTPVAYFIPLDRLKGMRPVQERISYMSVDATAGRGTQQAEKRIPIQTPQEAEPGPGLEELSSEIAAPPQQAESIGDSVMTVLQVDIAVARYDDSAAPPYPSSMLLKHMEGTVAIQYIVDTTGFADTSSVVVLAATHPDFATSVRNTLPVMHFRPAVMNARKVRQLVQQLFSFKIDTTLLAQQKKKSVKP